MHYSHSQITYEIANITKISIMLIAICIDVHLVAVYWTATDIASSIDQRIARLRQKAACIEVNKLMLIKFTHLKWLYLLNKSPAEIIASYNFYRIHMRSLKDHKPYRW